MRVSQLDDTEKDPQRMLPRSPQNSSISHGDGFSFMKKDKKKTSRNGKTNENNSSYGELQKKIDRLKYENAGLRKHLYN